MNLSTRDKRTIAVGAVLAALIVLGTPLFRKWSDMGSRLESRRAEVTRLKESTDGYDALVRRRDVLVSRLGSLLEPEESPADESGDKPTEGDKPAEDGKDNSKAPDTPEGDEGPSDETKSPNQDAKPPEGSGKPPTDGQDAEQQAEKKSSEDKQDAAGPEKPDDAKEKADKADEAEKDKEADPKSKSGKKKDDAGKPEARPSESVTGFVERVAKESGVKLKRMTPKKTPGSRAARAHFTPATVQVSMEATSESLLKMLHTLEKGGRFARVEQMQLLRNASKGNAIEVSLDVMAYQAGEG